jgi:hypothetical protein
MFLKFVNICYPKLFILQVLLGYPFRELLHIQLGLQHDSIRSSLDIKGRENRWSSSTLIKVITNLKKKIRPSLNN